jgi:hypothetical protein
MVPLDDTRNGEGNCEHAMTKEEFWQRVFLIGVKKGVEAEMCAHVADAALTEYSKRFPDKDGSTDADS